MKKIKLLIIGAVVCAAVVMSVHAVGFRAEVQGILLENIEALASDGESEGHKTDCYSVLSGVSAGARHSVTRCSTCNEENCESYTDSGKCRK